MGFVLSFLLGVQAAAGTIARLTIDETWEFLDQTDLPPRSKAGALVLPKSNNGIMWTVRFRDAVGVGFNDARLGASRKATAITALIYLGSVFGKAASLEIDFEASQTDGSGALAHGGTFFYVGSPGVTNGFAYDHALTGVDPSAEVEDVTCTVDFGYNWNSELDDPQAGEFDLYSVILHEVCHGLGMLSLSKANGSSALTGGQPGIFSVWDYHLATGSGADLWTSGGQFRGTAAMLTGGDGGVFFAGPNARAAAGADVQVNTPAVFTDRGSLSHWTTQAPGSPVMGPSLTSGRKKRLLENYELGVLRDLGWTVVMAATPTPVPSPSPTATPTPSPTPMPPDPAGLLDHLLGYTGTGVPADVNGDGRVDIADLIAIPR